MKSNDLIIITVQDRPYTSPIWYTPEDLNDFEYGAFDARGE